ncbi:MAG TPA: class I adenylate-forming enzyme family protein [Acidimicrobiia bacterium]|nr:class I adenylate-forming enzyme family protein [Acidimicrobiia bacterium]
MLGATLREAARRFRDQPAYVAPDGWPLSYAFLDRASDEVATGLTRRGVGLGDVVALVLPPGPEYLVAYLAAAKLGAVTTGVNDRLTDVERATVLELAGPRVVIGSEGATSTPHETVEVRRADTPDDVLRDLRIDGAPVPLEPDPERPVAIVFTSGTTGTPKGALYCNRQLSFITSVDVGTTWGAGGRGFTGTSFAHLGFMTKLPGNLQRGGTSFIMERWRAHDALALLEREGMQTVAGVPTQLALMLRDPDFDAFDLSSVGFIVVGGGPVTPGLAQEARARFDAKLATRYSCTEAGIGLGTGFDDPEEDAVISVGRPHAAVELGVLDDADEPVTPGDIGAVCLRSPAVMSGYWRAPDATRAAFTADGFVRTGDVGWVDDQGRLRLVGRSKEMYVRGGYNVYPVEVEAVLSTHPDVAHVAVVPAPDPVMGEVGVAFVVARDPSAAPTVDGLRDFGRDRLAAYKLPEGLRTVEALPLTAGEKVDRRVLREMLDAETPGDRPDEHVR